MSMFIPAKRKRPRLCALSCEVLTTLCALCVRVRKGAAEVKQRTYFARREKTKEVEKEQGPVFPLCRDPWGSHVCGSPLAEEHGSRWRTAAFRRGRWDIAAQRRRRRFCGI